MNDQQPPPAFPEARKKQHYAKMSLFLIILASILTYGFVGVWISDLVATLDNQNGTESKDGLRPAFLIAFLFIGFSIGFFLCVKFWRTIDEAARRAHLDAFYWGGPIAWMVIAPVVILPSKIKNYELSFIERLDMSSSEIFGLGIVTAVIATIIGYGVAWVIWWVTKR